MGRLLVAVLLVVAGVILFRLAARDQLGAAGAAWKILRGGTSGTTPTA